MANSRHSSAERFSRRARGLRPLIGTLVAVAMLAGCGSAATTSSVPTATTPSIAHRGMTASGDLLYVNDQTGMYIFQYPEGVLLATMTLPAGVPDGALCSDDKGDIFVPAVTTQPVLTGYIYEFAHEGTVPIKTLNQGGQLPFGCAVDPRSGDLAVTNFIDTAKWDEGSVLIYKHATGKPRLYETSDIVAYDWCTYDGASDLFITAQNDDHAFLTELSAGSSMFSNITLPDNIVPQSIAWDAGHLLVAPLPGNRPATYTIYRIKISGSVGEVVGSTLLRTHTNHLKRRDAWGQIVLKGKQLVGVGFNDSAAHVWPFPSGGFPTVSMKTVAHPYGVAVSVAPTR